MDVDIPAIAKVPCSTNAQYTDVDANIAMVARVCHIAQRVLRSVRLQQSPVSAAAVEQELMRRDLPDHYHCDTCAQR